MYVTWNRPSTTVVSDGETVETITGHVNYTAPDLSWYEVRTLAGVFVTVNAADVLSRTTAAI